jgi:hypothetical protein
MLRLCSNVSRLHFDTLILHRFGMLERHLRRQSLPFLFVWPKQIDKHQAIKQLATEFSIFFLT